MTRREAPPGDAGPIDRQRRALLETAGKGAIASTVAGAVGTAWAPSARGEDKAPLRWGVVGTGGIA